MDSPVWNVLRVPTPCRKNLDVAYTNICERLPYALNRLVDLYEEADEHHKFFGFDLEYTANQKDVVVIQIAFKETVLVFQWAISSKQSQELVDFLVNKGYDFCSVDITQDRQKLMRTLGIEIPEDHYIDLQDLIHFDELYGHKTGMAQMATAFIHPDYKTMKTCFPSRNHMYWGKNPLDRINLEYAAIDAYVAFELFRIYSSELE